VFRLADADDPVAGVLFDAVVEDRRALRRARHVRLSPAPTRNSTTPHSEWLIARALITAGGRTTLAAQPPADATLRLERAVEDDLAETGSAALSQRRA
jgi:hypothetical protein